jgi:glycosyltransferase involved in cell wall biosynthesis
MVIGIVISGLEIGGAEYSLVKLLNVIAPYCRKVLIICLSSSDRSIIEQLPKGVQVIELGLTSKNPIAWYKSYFHLKNIRPKLIIGWGTYANFIAIIVSFLLRDSKILISERLYVPKMFYRESSVIRRKIVFILMRLLYPKADIVTANSLKNVTFLRRFIGGKPRYKLLKNTININECIEKSNSLIESELRAMKGVKILALGRLDYQKGFDNLLHAFSIISKIKTWNLVIVGDGPEKRYLQELSKSLGVSNNVHFVPKAVNPFPYYKWADFVVAPSRVEGFPNAILESMSMGTPVICTNFKTGAAELTHNGKYGMLVPMNDNKKLAEAMLSLGQDIDKIKRLGLASQKISFEMYDAGIILDHYLNCLEL